LKTTAQAFGVPAKQLLHIPYLLYPEEAAIPKSDVGYFAYIGRLSREKGLSTLLRAMRQLPQVRLLIVGDGRMRPALERMVAELQLSGVRFAGYLSGEALNRALAQARFTVVPSEWYENSPYSVLESLAMGKPVVASRIGGIPELIDEGKDGLLFTPGDEDELVSCLRRLWNDPEETRRMGLKGRRKVLERYTPENHYRQLYPLYERLVSR
jgi:glycosyltransferase involved in cell wall biosynthesis